MESKEVNITYEILFEILKREKDMADLQKLEPNFFNNFIDYLKEKNNMMEKEESLFFYEEKKKIEKQIENARRMIKEIYERREKKILNIALIKSMTKSNIIDTSSLLGNEKMLLEEIENILNYFRDKVIYNVIKGRHIPELLIAESKNVEDKVKKEVAESNKGKENRKDTKLVRFLYSVPKFVGKELEEYGPFEEEDVANLPVEIADLLIFKGRVEEISSD